MQRYTMSYEIGSDSKRDAYMEVILVTLAVP